MYVLDSIVKNIGTPYTLFFGKNLYSTFMDSYASVNDSTRRKMEEMLKTWKEPVPGSIDKNPVFPPDVVRPIENALIKARTSALHAHQEQMRTQHQLFGRGGRQVAPHRNTPTPPNARQQFNQPQPPHPGVNGHRPESALGQSAYPQQPVSMSQPACSRALTDCSSSLLIILGQHRSRSCRPRPLRLFSHHHLAPLVPLLLNLE